MGGIPSRDKLCPGQRLWGSLPLAFTHHMCESVPLARTRDLSSVTVASDKMNATSRRVAGASIDNVCHLHTPPRPGATAPNGERDPKPRAPLSDWGCVLQKYVIFFFQGIWIFTDTLTSSPLIPAIELGQKASDISKAHSLTHHGIHYLCSTSLPLFQTCPFPRSTF